MNFLSYYLTVVLQNIILQPQFLKFTGPPLPVLRHVEQLFEIKIALFSFNGVIKRLHLKIYGQNDKSEEHPLDPSNVVSVTLRLGGLKEAQEPFHH